MCPLPLFFKHHPELLHHSLSKSHPWIIANNMSGLHNNNKVDHVRPTLDSFTVQAILLPAGSWKDSVLSQGKCMSKWRGSYTTG